MLNLPSTGTKYAKPIKNCFVAPKGRCILGADYSSQEHKANALITQDPNMLKEYISGLDGHCNRSYTYFKEQFPQEFQDKVDYVRKYGNTRKYYLDENNEVVFKNG